MGTGKLVSQAEAGYRLGMPLRQCGLCYMYWHRNTGKKFGGCTKVTGNISPYDICKFFNQLPNSWGNLMPAEARRQMEQFYVGSRAAASQAAPVRANPAASGD